MVGWSGAGPALGWRKGEQGPKTSGAASVTWGLLGGAGEYALWGSGGSGRGQSCPCRAGLRHPLPRQAPWRCLASITPPSPALMGEGTLPSEVGLWPLPHPPLTPSQG